VGEPVNVQPIPVRADERRLQDIEHLLERSADAGYIAVAEYEKEIRRAKGVRRLLTALSHNRSLAPEPPKLGVEQWPQPEEY
jgi:hypothetical protein